ncbi:MAG: lyase family protein, partial [Eubacteriales bacterium]|nr:lyase family protein [Eubacteriales bacterium]
MKLWGGRFQKDTNSLVNDFNSSISFDFRLYKQDIAGSIAHARMLGAQKIIAPDESEKLCSALEQILKDIENGSLQIDADSEDIHTFVEKTLISRIG